MTARKPAGRLASLALAVGLSACGSGEPRLDDVTAALAGCPAGDAPWREALELAAAEDRHDSLGSLAAELSERCPGRWEPSWTAGKCLAAVDRQADAAERFERALTLARAHDDPVGIACGADELGWLAYTAGRLDESRTLYDEALAAAESAERVDLESFTRNNLAGLLVDLGQLAEAREQLERAEAGLSSLGRDDAARGLAYNRAVILVELGDAVGARQTLEELHRTAEAAGDAWTLDAAAVVLGNLHLALDEPDDAEHWHGRVSASDPDLALLAQLGLGRVALARRDPERAVAILERAAGSASGQDRLFSGIIAASLADALRRAGRVDASRALLDRLLAGGEDELAADAAWEARWTFGRLLAQQGRTREAVAALEAAVVLLEAQGSRLDPLGEGLRFLRERFDPYVDLALAVAGTDEASSEQIAARILGLTTKAQARALRQALGGADGSVAVADPRRIQAGIGRRGLLVGFLLGEDHGLLLAVAPDGTRVAEIAGRRELAGPLGRFREALRQPAAAAADSPVTAALDDEAWAAGVALRRELLGPVEDLLGRAHRLYVVPDRELALLPFAALPLEPELGRGPRRHLGERLETALLPLAAPPTPHDGVPAPVLLAGQPTVDPGSAFPELPWAAYELSRLRELWGEERSSLLGGDAFSLAGIRAAGLDRYRTIHLATHAVASTLDPRRCGVILSHGERLGLDQIVDLPLAGSLVVLSACRTGEGELVPGEGVVGLGWAFLRAGARGVVVSQWAVDDAASARLMIAFHQRLRAGADPIAALAEARREVARERPHPAFWAPFVIVVRPEG